MMKNSSEFKTAVAAAMARPRPRLMGREVVETKTACPLCTSLGDAARTYGGEMPKLSQLADGSDDRLFCIGLHGYISAEEMA